MRYTVTKEMNGMRLDKALVLLLKKTSRSEIQKRIALGLVDVNGSQGKNNLRISESDIIAVKKEKKKASLPSAPAIVDVLYEDSDVIVICKPIGLVVHPTLHHPKSTLADILCKKYPEIAKVGDDPSRPGIVHRLDKDASGIMLIARNQDSFDSLKRQFKLHEIEKEYYAIVYGEVKPAEGTISLMLGRRNSSPKIVASPIEGRKATTHYWQEKTSGPCSLVRIATETGRTHQIRAHLYAVGHPLVGDSVYVGKKIKKIPSQRLMLHAYRIGFKDREGLKKTFTCALPHMFSEMLLAYSKKSTILPSVKS